MHDTRNRYRIKKQWARDDPAFTVILALIMIISIILHAIFFVVHSVREFIMYMI